MADDTDILENKLLQQYPFAMGELLCDRTTGRNIFWGTDSYAKDGDGYKPHDEITAERITGPDGLKLRPRALKARGEQQKRSRDKAEVFTPSWVCNLQNNMVDEAWFGREPVFNVADKDTHTWQTIGGKIEFPTGDADKTWQKYVSQNVLEVTCGEAPYLASRYDTVSGQPIAIGDRIGLLDRKLRVVGENAETADDWLLWAERAFQSTYGYEWQGDSLLLARINLLLTFADYYEERFHSAPTDTAVDRTAFIISWNLFQMDALKFVVPESCQDTPNILGGKPMPCPGCAKNKRFEHNGKYCRIMDWERGDSMRFVDLYNKRK